MLGGGIIIVSIPTPLQIHSTAIFHKQTPTLYESTTKHTHTLIVSVPTPNNSSPS